MLTYYTYDSAIKRLTPLPKYAMIDGAGVINPTREQCAKMMPPAYPLGTSTPPEPLEGKIAVPNGYEPVDTPDGKEWQQKWRYEDAPPPTPQTFSILKIEAALFKLGLLSQLDTFLDETMVTNELGGQVPLRRFYDRANDLRDDHPMFMQYKTAAQQALGLTDALIEEILSNCLIESN